MAVMRSIMYVPGNNPKMVEKAPSIPADIITLDLEDSVPPSEKEAARKLVAEKLKYAGSGGAQVYVRINNWETEMTNDDLEAVVWEGLDGVTLAKTGHPDDVKRLDWKLEELERRRGIPVGTVKISMLLETAKGIMNAYECCMASSRNVNAIFGAVDYCRDMRVKLTSEAVEQMWGRAKMAIAARAAGMLIIWFQNGWDDQYVEAGGPGSPNYHKSNALKTMRQRPELQGKLLAKGGWDYQLVDELTPQEGDIVLPKPRYSGFFNTPLDSILRSRGIRHLVFTGIATNVCVESTLRDGFFLEYFGIVLEDATHQAGPAFAQQAALFNIETFFGWVSDVESFCHALSPAAPLALAKEKRYA